MTQRKGHFIECGALDGETRSNSLFLEMENDWHGILIEADPISLAKIRYKSSVFNNKMPNSIVFLAIICLKYTSPTL